MSSPRLLSIVVHHPFRRSLLAATSLALCIALAGCGDGTGDAVGEVSSDIPTSEGAGDTTTAPGDGPDSTSDTSGPSTTEESVPTETTLPGASFDGFAKDGDELIVVGVAHDDRLNVREGPGTNFDVVAELESTADGVVATGRARQLARTIWYEVAVDGTIGWANSSLLAFAGVVDDATSAIVSSIGFVPGAETLVDLGTEVAEDRAAGGENPRIVLSVAPTVGDLGEITYDVIGLGDDAVVGLRLHIFAQPTDDGEGFSLKSVEQTSLCGRGVNADGLCV